MFHKKKIGETLHSTEEELKEITQYFENIFKQDNTTPLPNIEPQKLEIEITSEEVELAINKISRQRRGTTVFISWQMPFWIWIV